MRVPSAPSAVMVVALVAGSAYAEPLVAGSAHAEDGALPSPPRRALSSDNLSAAEFAFVREINGRRLWS